jgi:tetratricopeptide (TPR) repeat protein
MLLEFITSNADVLLIMQVFLITSCAGAVGGLVSGIIASDNSIRLMSIRKRDLSNAMWQVDLGFVGDMLVGSAAGIAILFFLYFADNKPKDLSASLHIVPIGLMAGVVSRRVLTGMASAAVEQLTSQTKQLTSETKQLTSQTESLTTGLDQVRRVEQMKELNQEGEQYLQAGQAEKLNRAIRIGKYESARKKFLLAIETMQGGHPLAFVNLGRTLKCLAGEAGDRQLRKNLLDEAIEAASKAIQGDPAYERAYYNRACYKALNSLPTSAVLDDLRTAIQLFDSNRVFASSDTDFDAIKDDPRFVALTREYGRENAAAQASGQ